MTVLEATYRCVFSVTLKELVMSPIVVAWAGAEIGITTIALLRSKEASDVAKNLVNVKPLGFDNWSKLADLTLLEAVRRLLTSTSPWSRLQSFPNGGSLWFKFTKFLSLSATSARWHPDPSPLGLGQGCEQES